MREERRVNVALILAIYHLNTINHENHLFNVIDPGAANWVSKYY